MATESHLARARDRALAAVEAAEVAARAAAQPSVALAFADVYAEARA